MKPFWPEDYQNGGHLFKIENLILPPGWKLGQVRDESAMP